MELLRDAFTGTPGDTLSVYNPNYVTVTGLTGIFVINANGTQINGDAAGGTAAYIRPDIVPPNADYLISADVTMVASVPSGPAAGVIGRASPSANTYYSARFLSAGSNTGSWQLRRVINGTVLAVASTPNVTYTNGQVFNVKLGMAGANLSLYLDGSSTPTLGPIADTGITAAGHPGIYGLNALSGRYRLDNLVVDDGQAASADISGSFAGALDALTLSASGVVRADGTFASSLAPLTLAASGVVGNSVSGAFHAALDPVAASFAGVLTNRGAFAASLAPVTLSAAGTASNRGAFAAQLEPITLSASGSLAMNVSATLSSTLDPVTMAAGGYVGTPPEMAQFFQRLPKNPRHYLPLQ